MQIWSIVSIKLALKFNWKISRNTSLFKENYIISLSENNIIGQGEVAFNIRYGESKESILEEFAWFCEQYNYKRVFNRNDLIWLEECKQISASLKMGINQAFYNFLCKKENISIEDILEVERPEAVISSFSIPILPEIDLADFLLRYNLLNYPFLKIKINGLKSVPLVNKLLSCYQGMIRIDANEGFYDYQEVLNFIKRISQISKIDFIEQPLPARLNHEMIYLKVKCGV